MVRGAVEREFIPSSWIREATLLTSYMTLRHIT